MNSVRVGFYVENYLPGGLERFLFDLIRELPAEGYAVTVFNGGDPALAARLRAAGLSTEVVLVPVPTGRVWEQRIARLPRPARRAAFLLLGAGRWLLFPFNALRLGRAFRGRIDVLHAVNGGYPAATSCLAAVVAARRAGVPARILSLMGIPRGRVLPGVEAAADAAVRASTGLVTVCCGAGRDAFRRRGFAEDRVRVVYNGIPAPRAPSPASLSALRASLGLGDGPVIGNVSALEPYKGHRVLVEAFAVLSKGRPGLRCLIVGDGSARESLEALSRRLGLGGRLVLTGRVPGDATGHLALMDVFVHPTLEDALPYAVMEAMGLERPIVASRLGGVPEMVQDGVSGLLVPPGDAAALAAAIAALLDDPEKARALAREAARRRGEVFTTEAMARGYRRAYEELLAREKGTAMMSTKSKEAGQ